jgi:heat-inducible transcriptional repressor
MNRWSRFDRQQSLTASSSTKMSLDDRAVHVLKNLVQTYIQDGQPVGSRTLSKLPDIGVSSATVRNVMADLEELGLIIAPHTSAGRIPTPQGYRFFVNSLVQSEGFTNDSVSDFVSSINKNTDPDTLIATASELVSELTHFAGVVLLPNTSQTHFHQLEFLKLSEHRVLAILVTEEGRVQNRVLPVEQNFNESELIEAANFFNHRYRGHTLEEVRQRLVSDMQSDNDEMHRINQTALQVASDVIAKEKGEHASELHLSGEQQLLNVPELCEIQTLQKLFDAFKTKRDLLDLLDRSMKADGMSVFIGEESGFSALGECSVIVSPYGSEGQTIGTLGVIGPTRMNYKQVMSVVDVTSKLLSQALSKNTN